VKHLLVIAPLALVFFVFGLAGFDDSGHRGNSRLLVARNAEMPALRAPAVGLARSFSSPELEKRGLRQKKGHRKGSGKMQIT